MRRAISAIVMFVMLLGAGVARAQEAFWVQLEANRTLREAEDAARRYAGQLADVNGFRLGASGWYAVALGPYAEAVATERLLTLRAQGAVPADAYVTDSGAFAQQFWPVGGTALSQAPAAPGTDAPRAEPDAAPTPEPVAAPVTETAPVPEPEPVLAEETRAEALASERLLDSEARKALQVALQWEGFYRSLIDGDFGPGTRGAMTAWQEAQGYEATGVLTTRQRAELLAGYNAVFESMGLAEVVDAEAGISLVMPAAMVAFDRYEAPFAHYEATGPEGVRVVLISQRGDRATLFGLYDILQSLSVVPPEGARKRGDQDFTIEATSAELTSYTHARLVDGAVKGYMLIWPQDAGGDPRRFGLVLEAMQKSFASTGETALDDNAGLDTSMQSIDLVSGLEIRRADRARSGIWVNASGAVITTIEAVEGCGRITLNESYDASVVATEPALGVALLRPAQPLAPLAVAEFLSFDPRLQSDLAVAGYSYGGRLSSPTLTFGKLADVRGLDGEEAIARLALSAQDGDAGGPVLDQGGAVIGMLMAPPTGGRMLPADVALVAKGRALAEFLAAQGVVAAATEVQGAMAPYDLSALAANVTALVSCWK